MPDVELHDRWLRVRFSAWRHADYHLRWLRHNCDQDLHPTTRERTLCSSEIPDDLRADAATVVDDALVVRWSHERRVSRYPLRWLEAHAYALDRQNTRIPNNPDAISIGDRGEGLLATVDRAIAIAELDGATIVRRAPGVTTPPEEETEPLIEAFAAAGLDLVGTHFGRIEDLRIDNHTNANTDQLGYTNAAIDLHTDQAFLARPPRFQLLQAVVPAANEGGASYLVDALAAASALREDDLAAYELLTRTPIRFHRKQKEFEKTLDAPILSGAGDSFQVRWSYFTLAPYALPFARMEAWYRAHDRFARLVHDVKNQIRFSLGRGDFVLFDNYRMLHGRTAFRGPRWLRGMYFDRIRG